MGMPEIVNIENFQLMLSQFSTTELESMIEKFPYFQQAHLLLAKKYQQENSPKFDQQLQLAALYIQDRELLYNLFNEKGNTEIPAVSAPETTTIQDTSHQIQLTNIPAKVALPEDEPIDNSHEVTPGETDIKLHLELIKQSVREINQFVKSDILDRPKIVTEETKQIVQHEEKQVEPIAPDEFAGTTETSTTNEDSAITALPVVQLADEIIQDIIPVTFSAQQDSISLPEDAATQNDSPTNNEVSTTPEPADIITPEKQEPAPTDEKAQNIFSRIEPHTFDEWLKAFNNKSVSTTTTGENPAQTNNDTPEDDELSQLMVSNISVDYLHELVKEETNYAKGLERFIEEQIQKHKQPETQKTAPENDFTSEPATETMARVYEMQKKYQRAIKTYEALAIKFPDKSPMFVNRIEYLKKLL